MTSEEIALAISDTAHMRRLQARARRWKRAAHAARARARNHQRHLALVATRYRQQQRTYRVLHREYTALALALLDAPQAYWRATPAATVAALIAALKTAERALAAAQDGRRRTQETT